MSIVYRPRLSRSPTRQSRNHCLSFIPLVIVILVPEGKNSLTPLLIHLTQTTFSLPLPSLSIFQIIHLHPLRSQWDSLFDIIPLSICRKTDHSALVVRGATATEVEVESDYRT